MEKIVLAISGGVDSAVAVHLLQKAGYEVYGYTFLCGDDEEKKQQTAEDAAKVAKHFGISHFVEDISAEFETTVIDYFCNAYGQAKTPNPCVFCNKTVKFPKVLAYADSMGIEKVATGHYVRMVDGMLRKGVDSKKDQSYFLCLLPKAYYPRLVFPLGDYLKSQIREIAAELGLECAEKGDSQEICFIPDDDYKTFLMQKRPETIVAGDFADKDGKILGKHKGLPFYTVGQRRGIGLAFGTPKYVTALDGIGNRVIIGDAEDLYAAECTVINPNFIEENGEDLNCDVKIRYLSQPVPAEVMPGENGIRLLRFAEPQKSVTPGQFAVFYRDDILLGGGEIKTVK